MRTVETHFCSGLRAWTFLTLCRHLLRCRLLLGLPPRYLVERCSSNHHTWRIKLFPSLHERNFHWGIGNRNYREKIPRIFVRFLLLTSDMNRFSKVLSYAWVTSSPPFHHQRLRLRRTQNNKWNWLMDMNFTTEEISHFPILSCLAISAMSGTMLIRTAVGKALPRYSNYIHYM